MKKQYFAYIVLLTLVIASCRREFKSPSWDVNLKAPLVYSDMGIEDIIPDSIIEVNADNTMNLVFDQKFFTYGIDSVLELPDSTIRDSFVSFGTGFYAAGATLFTNTDNSDLTVNGAELTQIILKQGYIDYKIKSTVPDPVTVVYNITSGTQNGGPLAIEVTIPGAASVSNPAIVNGTFSLANADLDLTGPLHNTMNAYQTKFVVKAPPSSGVNLTAIDSRISIQAVFRDMVPSYGRGYFGQFTEQTPLSAQVFDFFKNINTATVDLSHVDAKLYISNGLGADARIRIDTVEAINTNTAADVLLNHAIIGQNININRAQDLSYAALPYVYSVDVNSSNSNIENFLETLPDLLKYKMRVELNPLGNVSGHTDFLYSNSRVEAGIRMDIPLNFMASGLRLSDTVSFNLDEYDQNGKILKGKIKFNIVNGLPLQASLKVMMLDENNILLGNLLDPAVVAANAFAGSSPMENNNYQTLYGNLDENNISLAYKARKLVIYSEFSTIPAATFVNIYSTQRFKTQISVQADYLINAE